MKKSDELSISDELVYDVVQHYYEKDFPKDSEDMKEKRKKDDLFKEFFKKRAIYTKTFKDGQVIRKFAPGTPLEQCITKHIVSQEEILLTPQEAQLQKTNIFDIQANQPTTKKTEDESSPITTTTSKDSPNRIPQDGDRVYFTHFIKILLEPLPKDETTDKFGLRKAEKSEQFWNYYENNTSPLVPSLSSGENSNGCFEYFTFKNNLKAGNSAMAVNIGSISDRNKLGFFSFIMDCLKTMKKGETSAYIVPPLFIFFHFFHFFWF